MEMGKMGKKRNEVETIVTWSEHNEKALLLRLLDHRISAMGRHPTAVDWDRWAGEIFGQGVPGERCKQKRNRLRKNFQLYSVLINATGLGWDPNTGAIHCETEYLEDFLAGNPHAKDLIGKAVPNWTLISQLFHRECATGSHAVASGSIRLTEATNSLRTNSEREGLHDQMNIEDDNNSAEEMAHVANLAGLGRSKSRGRACNITPSSKTIGERPVHSKGAMDSHIATTALQSIVNFLSNNNRSKGTSGRSLADQHALDDREWRQCLTIINEMNLSLDEHADFIEYLSTNPKMQTAFIMSRQECRMTLVRKGITRAQYQQRQPPERMPPPPVLMQAPPAPIFYPQAQYPQAHFYPNFPYFPRPPYGGHGGY